MAHPRHFGRKLASEWSLLRSCSHLARFCGVERIPRNGQIRNLSVAARLPFEVSPEVRDAIDRGQGVVALESTIITHGMPYPQNLDTAIEVENIVRGEGCVPATIAILDGQINVGLTAEQLATLAKLGHSARKCSRRDIAVAVAKKENAATTVAGTMFVSHLAGIKVFATGGIGGVHRGAESSFDISADLTELGRTPVAVVCAGVKSILDIPKTLEFLETQGVPVITYGSDYFPAFFSPSSGLKSPSRMDNLSTVAETVHSGHALEMSNGLVLAVPNPEPADESLIENATKTAIAEAASQGIHGAASTPFLLQRVCELTAGESLRANVGLIKNNARVGAQLASLVAAKLQDRRGSPTRRSPASRSSVHVSGSASPGFTGSARTSTGVVVLGGAAVDIISRPLAGLVLQSRTSTPGTVSTKWGGVGRNIAEALGRLDCYPHFVSVVGTDALGAELLQDTSATGVCIQNVVTIPGRQSATYCAQITESGDLLAAVADMAIYDCMREEDVLAQLKTAVAGARAVVLDGNIPAETMEAVVSSTSLGSAEGIGMATDESAGDTREAKIRRAPWVWFEPTSVVKAVKPVQAKILNKLHYISPNVDELVAIATALKSQISDPEGMMQVKLAGSDSECSELQVQDAELEILAKEVLSEMTRGWLESPASPVPMSHASSQTDCWDEKAVIVTLGERGAYVCSARKQRGQNASWEVTLRHSWIPTTPAKMVNCTGAGDNLVAGTVFGLLRDIPIEESIQMGMVAAKSSLASEEAVSFELCPEMLLSKSG